MKKIMLIKKYSSKDCFFWDNLPERKTIENLSVENVIDKYQGFEGEFISFFYVDELDLQDISLLIEEMRKVDNSLMLYLSNNSSNLEDDVVFNNRAAFVGYDYGLCEELDEAIYSSIFNEILFGVVEDLIKFKERLNENLLFPNLKIAEEYAHTHHQLFLKGEDVEAEDSMYIYKIWKIQ